MCVRMFGFESACFSQSAWWPLVWKTWKCQGIWNMSGKCQGLC